METPEIRSFGISVFPTRHLRLVICAGSRPSPRGLGWRTSTQPTQAFRVQPARLSEFYARAYSEMSEDCLTLNVWSRAITSADKLPVMFWIHGGALVMGSGGDYDGASLPPSGSYDKLPSWSIWFLRILNFIRECQYPVKGFRDQIAALEWVRQHRTLAETPTM